MDVPKGEPCPSCNESGKIEKHISFAPPWVDGAVVNPHRAVPAGFRDVLSRIHERTYKSTLNSKF